MKRTELTSKVFQLIESHQPIKASKIAKALEQDTGETILKKDVNSVLYSELRDRVVQDKKYRWKVVSANDRSNDIDDARVADSILKIESSQGSDPAPKKPKLNHETFKKNNTVIAKKLPTTTLSKLARYYLDCLSFERDTEVSVFSKSKYESTDYVQLKALPEFDEDFHELLDSDEVRNLTSKMKRSGGNQTLYLGYPVFVRPTPKGNYIKLEPLFLFAFTQVDQGGPLSLTEDAPRLNLAGFKGYAEESGSLFDELVHLQSELQLDQKNEDLPSIDELILRLKSARPLWPWVGDIDPYNLSEESLAITRTRGIHNTAMLVRGEGSKFTQGLESELGMLANGDAHDNQGGSALSAMLDEGERGSSYEDVDIIEALQLNHEQKEAIKAAFNNKLSVITGPPGTGKSQVVTSIIINAAHKGWKVLFTSKNNKAVDVVQHRVNGLADQPLLLRLGAKELQKSLAEKLSNLLATEPSEGLQEKYDRFEEKHQLLKKELEGIQLKMSYVTDLRNKVDRLDQKIEGYRKKIPEGLFGKISFQLVNQLEEKILATENAVQAADAKKLGVFTRLLIWWAIKEFRYKKLERATDALLSFLGNFGLRDDANFDQTPTRKGVQAISFAKSHLEFFELCFEYKDLSKKLTEGESFEDLCSKHAEVHDRLTDTDEDLWHAWLELIANRMTFRQRKTLGEYVSTLKYIVDASESGSTVNKKTWRDYYKLSEQVAYLLPAWAITSLSAKGRLPLQAGAFDLLIIDEASQCDIASALPLLYRAKRAVVIGDPNQLRHITTLSGKQDLQLIESYDLDGLRGWGYAKNSCFDVANTLCQKMTVLREHHRSHQDIIQFSNQNFYGNKLRVATKMEKLKRLQKGDSPSVEWLSVQGEVNRYRGSGACNEIEAEAIVKYLLDLVKNRKYEGTIGIVTPFRGQAIIINEKIAKSDVLQNYLLKSELLVDTVHKFQGDEKDLMIFSPVVSRGMATTAMGFLRSQGNLFNVAITRARAHLVVVGDQQACRSSNVSYLANFVDYVEQLKEKNKFENIIPEALEPEYPKAVYDPQTVSDWEVFLYKALFSVGLRPVPQYREDKYRLDFALFDGDRKLNIEVDGERYHKDWTGQLRLEDQIRNERLKELGWSVKRFWVFQVRDNLDSCVEEIKAWKNRNKAG